MSRSQQTPERMPDRMRCAVTAAETASRWWDLAVSTQRAKSGPTVDHGDLYGLAGEMVATLRALEELAGALARQAERYGEGRVLRDDAGSDPADRLEDAATAADLTRAHLNSALRQANAYWSAMGHIGVEHDPATGPRQAIGPGAVGRWSR